LEEKCGGAVVRQQKMRQVVNSRSMFLKKMKMKTWSNRKRQIWPLKTNMQDATAAKKKVIELKIALEIQI
jgi:hypothetical protein